MPVTPVDPFDGQEDQMVTTISDITDIGNVHPMWMDIDDKRRWRALYEANIGGTDMVRCWMVMGNEEGEYSLLTAGEFDESQMFVIIGVWQYTAEDTANDKNWRKYSNTVAKEVGKYYRDNHVTYEISEGYPRIVSRTIERIHGVLCYVCRIEILLMRTEE